MSNSFKQNLKILMFILELILTMQTDLNYQLVNKKN